jgi:hypothetical protein
MRESEVARKVEAEAEWARTKEKISLKAKIINDRFYYNYCFHCLLLTSSPLSIVIYCQIIAPTVSALPIAILSTLLYITVLAAFCRFLYNEYKPYSSTKYCFIIVFETLIINGFAVLGTAQIYIGTSILLFLINVYLWNRIFKSKRASYERRFLQINEVLRGIILLEVLIGYTKIKKWDASTYYVFSWTLIVTAILLIILVAVQSTKQFFDSEDGTISRVVTLKGGEHKNEMEIRSVTNLSASRQTSS